MPDPKLCLGMKQQQAPPVQLELDPGSTRRSRRQCSPAQRQPPTVQQILPASRPQAVNQGPPCLSAKPPNALSGRWLQLPVLVTELRLVRLPALLGGGCCPAAQGTTYYMSSRIRPPLLFCCMPHPDLAAEHDHHRGIVAVGRTTPTRPLPAGVASSPLARLYDKVHQTAEGGTSWHRSPEECSSAEATTRTRVVRVGAGGCLLLHSPRLPLPLPLLGWPQGLDGPVDQPMLKAAAPAA